MPPHKNIYRYLNISVRRARTFEPDQSPTTTASKEGSLDDARSPTRNASCDFSSQSAGNRRSIPQKSRNVERYDSRRSTSKPFRSEITAKDEFDEGFDMPDTIEFDENVHGVRSQNNDWTSTYQPRESTITTREKIAFQKIFSDIFVRSQKTNPNPHVDSASSDFPSDATKTGDRQKAKTALDNILSGAIQRHSKDIQDYEQAISQFPPALRDDAAKAMGFGVAENEEVEEERASREALQSKADELEALRAPERLRVETLMREAKTDLELWQVMEEEVFSLISKLGLEEHTKLAEAPRAPKLPEVDRKKKGWKKLQKRQEAEQRKQNVVRDETSNEKIDEKACEETEDGVSSLQIHGPLYPSFLLLGLRLLDRSFAKPSPLALSILPRIKTLGFISHVLGASTQFYNDLLRIYRYRYDDFPGMIDLLNEMEQSALDMDEETLTIVLEVLNIQRSVNNNDMGYAVRSLWSMPEFQPGKFAGWKNRISHSIEERKQHASTQVY
ncbi:hypothetical protein EG329_009721 [Mollisiaceae sp. DMI_Dod_QoI]|nr:hypothetical protein EG329_009721 [Helotiales sp. DMI_Dod_QoI]